MRTKCLALKLNGDGRLKRHDGPTATSTERRQFKVRTFYADWTRLPGVFRRASLLLPLVALGLWLLNITAFAAGPPVISDPGGSSTSTTSGNLFVFADPNGADATFHFEYGPDLNFGSSTPDFPLAAIDGEQLVQEPITGLMPATTYYIRAIAVNSEGTTISSTNNFDTLAFDNIGLPLPHVASADDPGGAADLSELDYQMGPQAASWADFDNDGDLDLLLTGLDELDFLPVTQLWQNNGDGTFTEVASGLPDVSFSAVAWGDYDNDGWLDVAISGVDCGCGATLCQVWRNQQDGTFALMADLGSLNAQSLAWGDYDNDGKPDLLLAGSDVCDIWRNNGDGTFTQINAGFIGVIDGGASWGDYDNDGRLDVIQTGWDDFNGTEITQLWHNNVNGTFNPVSTQLPAISLGYAQWVDFNNDGRLDILIHGTAFDPDVLGLYDLSEVWFNDGGGVFSKDPGANLLPMDSGAAVVGDFDNDGLSDIMKSGFDDISTFTTTFEQARNLGDGTFQFVETDMPPVTYSSLAFGDYDNDGRLDLLLVGATEFGFHSQVWHNLYAEANTPPTSPGGLAAVLTGTGVILSWNAGSDTQTPADGLTYNVRVGTTPGGSDIVSAQAAPDGYRRLPQMGNAQHNHSFILRNLAYGTYYWSVQAIDTSFAGSPFAAEGTFVTPVAVNDAVERAPDKTVKVRAAKLAANDVAADGSTLTVTGVGSPTGNGATVIIDTGWVIYMAPVGFNGTDTFTYDISDGNGGTATGTVTVLVLTPADSQTRNITAITPLSGGSMQIDFVGIPGGSYDVEATEDLSTPWTFLGTVVASGNGAFQFIDTDAPNHAARFYRAFRP